MAGVSAPGMHRLEGEAGDYDALLESIGDASLVLLGDATHGSHELYLERARITCRLVEELGFDAVIVEADWPDAQRVNAYVGGRGHDADAAAALGDFVRFPRWVWRNTVVAEFVEWLRHHNAVSRPALPVGFHGLDLYSLTASIDAVLAYLDRRDPAAAARARARYSCFDHVGTGGQVYAEAIARGQADSCEEQVAAQLKDVLQQIASAGRRDAGDADAHAHADDAFDASQNARLVRAAEHYSRALSRGRVASWNLRDAHMADTVDALAAHLGRDGRTPRIVVWAHNSHLGDARATEMAERGEHSLGQLLRQRHPGKVVAIGFTTATGAVTAAEEWAAPAYCMDLRPPVDGSIESSFHKTGAERLMLAFPGVPIGGRWREPWLERAIGAIYRPEAELFNHYFRVRPADQFDVFVHIDFTHPLEPLDAPVEPTAGRGATRPQVA